mmetsp:Transcript_2949/g.3110  ORF Transcript_2949/g.3110 Transcript_2949/m.3110 type:complete len:395 (+) Transcript_2949:79-1263(+)
MLFDSECIRIRRCYPCVFLLISLKFVIPGNNYNANCIPTIGTAVVSDPNEYLPRVLLSIDFCVNEVILYHGYNMNLTSYGNILEENKFVERYQIVEDSRYLFGVSEGWNAILRISEKSNHPWLIMVAFDIIFPEGELQRLNSLYRSGYNSHNGNIFAYVNYVNFDTKLAAYNTFLMSQEVVSRVGYFDENFFPAFYEDNDWSVRLRLAGVVITTFTEIKLWHGDLPKHNNSSGSKDYFSGTRLFINTMPYWDQVSRKGIQLNNHYFQRKWNCSYTHGISINTSDCRFTTPFGKPENTVRDWVKNDTRVGRLRSCVEQPLLEAAATYKTQKLPSTKRAMYVKMIRVRHMMGIYNPKCTLGVAAGSARRVSRPKPRPKRKPQIVLNMSSYVDNMPI